MPLITRQDKGSKLTIQDLDNNLIYLENLALNATASQGATGPQGIQGATGPQGATGSYQSLTYSVGLEVMSIDNLLSAIDAASISYFSQPALVSFNYTFEGLISTYSQISPVTFSQTLMNGFFSLGPSFPGLDQNGMYKRWDFANSVVASEWTTSGLTSKYYYNFWGATGSPTSSQHRHKFYYNDDLARTHRGEVNILYDGTFTYSIDINYSNF
jgi:hypothetical protein